MNTKRVEQWKFWMNVGLWKEQGILEDVMDEWTRRDHVNNH